MREHCQTLCPCSEVDIGQETKILFLSDYKILKEEKHSCWVERGGLESHSGPVAAGWLKEQATLSGTCYLQSKTSCPLGGKHFLIL